MPKNRALINAGIAAGSILAVALAVGAYSRLTRPQTYSEGDSDGGSADGGDGTSVVPLTGDQHCGAAFFGEVVEKDAARFEVPQVAPETLAEPIKGGVEFSGSQLLSGPQAQMDTPHLHLATDVEALYPDPSSGRAARVDHLVLSITNRGHTPIAYRVVTKIEDKLGCSGKGTLPHNALGLRRGETARRTECLYHPRQELRVVRVEVYEVTELGHRYLSRLTPTQSVAFDMRVSAGHDAGGLVPCGAGGWRDLEPFGPDAWHMLVDFYARHNCEHYGLSASYRPWTVAGKLPYCDEVPQEPEHGPAVAEKAPRHDTSPWVYVQVLFGVVLVVLLVRRRKEKPQKEAPRSTVLEMKGDEEDQFRHDNFLPMNKPKAPDLVMPSEEIGMPSTNAESPKPGKPDKK